MDGTGKSACCAPKGAAREVTAPVLKQGASDDLVNGLRADLVALKGGFFDMGARRSTYPGDFDAPRRKVRLSPFTLSRTTVPARMFAAFARESGYRTVAEKEGWSFVFHGQLADPAAFPDSPQGTPWWRRVPGACWSAPLGPGSDWRDGPDLPAVHLSWFDAQAMADFTGLRLPTEAEWEYAARGGLSHKRFPWGNALVPESGHRHNVWQGSFPDHNTAEDGHTWSCPVDAFPPNDFGLHNMTGNVWEWCPIGSGRYPLAPRCRAIRKELKAGRGGSCAAGRSCATHPTASGIRCIRGHQTPQTVRPPISACA